MENVLLVIHLIACIALVISVLLQRSEGGALGMGGGGTGGIISGRGAASVLVRTTMVLAGIFIVTSVVMTRLNAEQAAAPSDVQRQLEQRQNAPFDPLAGSTTTPPPASTPTPATPAPSIDPLAPQPSTTVTPQPAAPATQPPAATPSPAPARQATPSPAPATQAAPQQPPTQSPAPAQPTPTPAPSQPNP